MDEFLQTGVPGIYAAGDIAEWQSDGERRRVEHWVLAERHGQAAAENMLGRNLPFSAPPFFWSAHYDVTIRYVGYARSWDSIEIGGSIEHRDCVVEYRKAGKTVAIASIGRDIEALEFEVRMAEASS